MRSDNFVFNPVPRTRRLEVSLTPKAFVPLEVRGELTEKPHALVDIQHLHCGLMTGVLSTPPH